MAQSGIINGTPASNRNYLYIEWTESEVSSTNNTSKVTATVKLYNAYGSYSSGNACPWYVIIDGTRTSGTIYTWSGTPVTVGTASKVITHNSNGAKSITISANFDTAGTSTGVVSASGTATLTTIQRYATVTQTVQSKTETSIVMNWSADATVDQVWYSKNNGSSWTSVGSVNATSGSYSISGLSVGTAYNIKTRVRRKDSQLNSESSAMSVSTYQYPHADTTPNFTIGQRYRVSVFNPLERSITVEIIGANNSVIQSTSTTHTTNIEFHSSTAKALWYASIPNATQGTYKVRVTYDSNVDTRSGGTYSINESECEPQPFTPSYADTNATTLAVTNNNQEIIQGKSTVQYTASGLAGTYSATIVACSVSVNGQTINLTVSGNTASGSGGVINSGTDVEAVFTVTDSRGLTRSISKTVTMLAWQLPSFNADIHRRSNFYAETDMTVHSTYSYLNGNNSVTISYRARKTTSWTVTGSLTDGVTGTAILDNAYLWTIQITVADVFDSVMREFRVARGMPLVFFDRVREAVGVNCFPSKDQTVESIDFDMEYPDQLVVNSTDFMMTTYQSLLGWGQHSLTSVKEIFVNILERLYNRECIIQAGNTSTGLTTITAGTITKVPMNTTTIDMGSGLTTSDGGVKVLNAGTYRITASCYMSTPSDAVARGIFIRVGSAFSSATEINSYNSRKATGAESGAIHTAPKIVTLNTNDIVYMGVRYQTGSGGGYYGSNVATYLLVERVK